jgi:beta propeller repeat protein
MFAFLATHPRFRSALALSQIITLVCSVALPWLALSFGAAQPAHAAVDDTKRLWGKLWGTPGDDYTGGASVDGKGNIYLTVSSLSADSKESNLVKLTADGAEVWRRPLIRTVDARYKVAADQDGNAFAAGGTNDFTELLKYDEDGGLLWSQELDSRLRWPAVSVDPSGNAYVAGTSKNGQAFLAKYDQAGAQTWIKETGTDAYDRAVDVSAETSGTVHLLGETRGALEGQTASGGWSDSFVVNFKPDGTKRWVKQSGSGSSVYMATPNSIATDNYGRAYTTVGEVEWRFSQPEGSYWWLTKHTAVGGTAWKVRLPTATVAAPGVAVDRLENVYVFGKRSPLASGDPSISGVYLAKYDDMGDLKWTRTIGSGSETPAVIRIGDFGDMVIAGHTSSGFGGNVNAGGRDAFITRYEGEDRDTDGDGLLDKWETKGLTLGGVFVDLPAMGADPNKKDIFVEVDWMPTKKPKKAAIDKVIKAFAEAPVDNPNGTRGINLHVDMGPKSVMRSDTGELWGKHSRAGQVPYRELLGSKIAKKYSWADFDLIKNGRSGWIFGTNGNFDHARKPVFHYGVFADKLGDMGTTSGMSRGIGASDFIVSLGGFTDGRGTALEQAGTFMHELGHNLGLRHGGLDHVHYKPNYLSIMNYTFQFSGLIKKQAHGGYANGHYDFSIFDDLLSLNEDGGLNEPLGVSSASGNPSLADYRTVFYYVNWAGNDFPIETTMTPINWNQNGINTETTATADINKDGKLTTLAGHEDWNSIIYKGGSIGKLGRALDDLPAETPDLEELTEEANEELLHLYRVAVLGPENTAKEPGGSLTHTFTVANKGEKPDTYAIQATSTGGWANLTGVPALVALAPEETFDIVVPVAVPAAAPIGAEDEIVLSAVSQTSDQIIDSRTVATVAKPKGVGFEVRLTNSYYPTNYSPAVSGDWVVWHEAYQGIWAYNAQTGARKIISNTSGQRPHIDAGRVVYSKTTTNPDGSDNYDIYLYDLATDTERRITTDPKPQITPRIHGNRIVWQDGRIWGNADIYMYDLSTDTEHRITDDPKHQVAPDIHGDKIVWEDYRNVDARYQYNHDIYMYDLGAQTEKQITTQTYMQQAPRVHGDTIVWWDQRNDSGDVYLYDLSTDTERGLIEPGYQANPDIDGNRIVYTDWGLRNVFMYNLKTEIRTQITNHAQSQFEPAIHGKRIVYRDSRHSSSSAYTDIYMTNLLLGEPVTSITTDPAAPGAGGWFTARPEITLTPDRTGASTYYQWDSTSELGWSGYTGAFEAPEGEHTLYYYSDDKVGNTEEIRSAAFKVDTTAPETVLSSDPSFDDLIYDVFKSVPQISLDSGESGAVYYQWDSTSTAGWLGYSAPIEGMEGEHTLYYYSTDAQGNSEEIQSRLFTVDTALDSTAAETSLSTDPSFPADDGPFGEAPIVTFSTDERAIVYYQWDSVPAGEFTTDAVPPIEWLGGDDPVFAPFTEGLTVYRGRFLAPEGTHTLYYYSVDAAGNAEPVKSRTFTVSTQTLGDEPPTTVAVPSGLSGNNSWYISDVQVSLIAAANDFEIATTEYRIDGGAWLAYIVPFTVTAEGNTTVEYRSVDTAGNLETAKTMAVRIDKTRPAISVAVPEDGKTYRLNETALADWSAADGVSGIAQTQATVAVGQPIDTSSLGSKAFLVEAQDNAGNSAAKLVTYFVDDWSGPAFQLLAPLDKTGLVFTHGSAIPVKFQLRDANGDYITNAAPELFVAQVINGEAQTEAKAISSSSPRANNVFRYDSDDNQYVFNLNTKVLAVGTWRLRIDLGDGSLNYVDIALR